MTSGLFHFVVLGLLLVLFQTGCGGRVKPESTVIGEEGRAQGQWRGRALVKNLKNGKTNTLSLDILAREPSQMRMELLGAFGVHGASIVLNGQEVKYSLTQEKRFIVAPADNDALLSLIPIRLSPRALIAVLFDRELPESEWKCQLSRESGLPDQCVHKREKVSVKWIQRQDLSRRLKIGAAEAEIEMVLDQAKSKVEFDEGAFELSAPQGYRVEKL